jgi:hypothetical protein
LQATNGFAGDFVTPTANARYLLAPAGTTSIRYQVTMNNQGGTGSVAFDAMSLREKKPVRLAVSQNGANVNLSWSSTCDTSYQVYVKTNVTDAWSPSGAAVAGTGGTVTVVLPNSGNRQFYRVQTL